MTLAEEVKKRLTERPKSLDLLTISVESGINYHWLTKISSNSYDKTPKEKTLKILNDYLKNKAV